MVCPKCGSNNVNVVSEQVNAKTSSKGNGCLENGKNTSYYLHLRTLVACRKAQRHKQNKN